MEDKGYYGQYLYGRSSLILSPRFEALGEALAVLFDVADSGRAVSIIGNSPLTTFGTTCVYPQTPGIPPYHNNAIWPFVQSYWNLAAAKTGNETVLQHGLAAIYRAGALFLTNYENMVADNGDYVGTEINSSRMLWSMAGNLAMVHRLFIGLHFEPEGIRFQPVIPSNYSGNKSLENFHYRNCTLDIKVSGHGNKISSITLDDSPLKDAFLPASTVGKHVVKIEMNNNNMEGPINLVDNHFVLETPIVKLDNATLRWPEIKGAQHYIVYENGQKIAEVTSPELQVKTSAFYEYMVTAIDGLGYESFANEPVVVFPEQAEKIVETESMMKKSLLPYTNYSGDGFIKISTTENRKLAFNISVKEKGRYLIDLRYANGTGPWNTDNNCAIRSVYINNTYQGVFVMPQRGTDEWSDWGFTNAIEVELEKGTNTLTLQFDSWNTNMDGDINEALIDYIRLIQIEHN